MRRSVLGVVVLALALLVPSLAGGHAERPTPSPARDGDVPNPNRVPTQIIDVCKTGECAYEHIQAAVFAAHDGALIRVWPGLYNEEPSRAMPSLEPDAGGFYSYEHHLHHPNSQNLIAIVGKKNITVRGMGADPHDVVIDAAFKKHVGIRGDRADGLILENFSMYHAFDHGVYVLDQSGYLIDRVVSGWSRDYSFLMFATDHGLIKNCEAFGAGDAGIYPGGEPNTPGRHSNEVTNCRSHHNVIGYSGTQGNYVWVHDTEFDDNAVAMTSDSETDHPNYPQESLTIERNKIHDNNFNVYAEDSDVFSVFGDGIYLPVGTGVFLPSGNKNLVQNNEVWGNDRYGIWLGAGQGMVQGPTSDPAGVPFISTANRFIGNKMYGPSGKKNGIDFAWDGMGLNNCWEGNVASANGDAVTSDAPFLPPCSLPPNAGPMPITAGIPYPVNMVHQAGILFVPPESPVGAGQPIACFIDIGGCVWGPGPKAGNARNTPEGYKQPPPPASGTCGPTTCPHASAASVKGTKKTRTFSGTASALPATGVGTPVGLAIALLIGAAVIAAVGIRGRFRSGRAR